MEMTKTGNGVRRLRCVPGRVNNSSALEPHGQFEFALDYQANHNVPRFSSFRGACREHGERIVRWTPRGPKKCLAKPERSWQSHYERRAHESFRGTIRSSRASVSASKVEAHFHDFLPSVIAPQPLAFPKRRLTEIRVDVYVHEHRCTLRAARTGVSGRSW